MVEPKLLSSSLIEDALQYFNRNHSDLEYKDSDKETDAAIIAEFVRNTRFDAIEAHEILLVDDDTFFELAEKLSHNPKLSYKQFTALKEEVSVPLKKHFTASSYLLFCKDLTGEINSDEFLRFVQRSIDVERTFLRLLKYSDTTSSSHLISEMAFERYLFDLIPELNFCQNLEEWFHPYYVFAASRRFLLFLDQRKSRFVSIKKLAHSPVMEELLFLKRLSQYERDMDPLEFQSQVSANWFDGENALRMYNQFTSLDKDQNGMLSLDELVNFAGVGREHCQFTSTAVERLLSVHVVHSPAELDFKGYIDLIVALEHKNHAASLSYFWKILDIDGCGRLTPTTIKYFYSDIYYSLRNNKYEAPTASYVVTEVFDILGCNNAEGPTFEEFKSSGQGSVVASMLLDVNGFWQYDNRESLMQQADAQNEDEQ